MFLVLIIFAGTALPYVNLANAFAKTGDLTHAHTTLNDCVKELKLDKSESPPQDFHRIHIAMDDEDGASERKIHGQHVTDAERIDRAQVCGSVFV